MFLLKKSIKIHVSKYLKFISSEGRKKNNNSCYDINIKKWWYEQFFKKNLI